MSLLLLDIAKYTNTFAGENYILLENTTEDTRYSQLESPGTIQIIKCIPLTNLVFSSLYYQLVKRVNLKSLFKSVARFNKEN